MKFIDIQNNSLPTFSTHCYYKQLVSIVSIIVDTHFSIIKDFVDDII